MRFLINIDGAVFETAEIQTLSEELDALDDNSRAEYRNKNASAIAEHDAVKFLIVSGPGTGKSHLFLDRINHWYTHDPQAKVIVTSFVRKLVADLQNDIQGDDKLSEEQKSKIMTLTLHKFARSIVEQNRGTANWQFQPHFRIIGQSWKEVVWADVLAFYPSLDERDYPWKKFEEQLHNAAFEETEEWQNLAEAYFELCQFYNAAGFADLILRATEALAENPQLSESEYFIIDEYQDFNSAEDALINQLIKEPNGLLVVGDDEQVLYEKLKSGKPTLIRNLYQDGDYANGMLPFCGRSSFHITKTAGHFIQQHREGDCIEKIYLPIKADDDYPKVQVVACATAATAVDYIEEFVAENKAAIDERKIKLNAGEAKDAFLLILTPAKELNFYARSKGKIDDIVAEYRAEDRFFSEDYYKLLSYYSLANHPDNNFTFRKVLHYEGLSQLDVHELIAIAIQEDKPFYEVDSEIISAALEKAFEINRMLDADNTTEEKIAAIMNHISISDPEKLRQDIERKGINQEEVAKLEHEEEEEAELEEIEIKQMCAVELMTIVGSKGLSADHVIIVGFDNVNMNWVTKNAFYVAMTRARKSLHILTALKSGGARGPHNFLRQLPGDHIDFHRYTKSGHVKTQLTNRRQFERYLDRLNSAASRRV